MAGYTWKDAILVPTSFHRTLNMASAIMAAAIVLGGGGLNRLSFPMGLALALFILALVAGVLLLLLLHWPARLRRPGIWTLLLTVALRPPDRAEATEPRVLVPMVPVPLALLTIATRLTQMIFVAGGFALVFWSFGREVFPAS